MKLFCVTVRDSAADSYHAPLCFPALGMAERWFRDEINTGNPESQLARHPEDYELYLIGDFETATAEVVPQTARLIIRGLDAVKAKQ